MKLGIIGFGSFTREILPEIKRPFDIFVTKDYLPVINVCDISKKYKCNVFLLENFDTKKYEALITNVSNRKDIIQLLPRETKYTNFISKYARILGNDVFLGKSTIICAGSILTTNIKIGDFSQINLNTTIGHDCCIDNYFTTAPGVNISGNCIIGKNVYIGTNSSVKEKVKICDNVIIGMQSGVIKNIDEYGTYAGSPVQKINYNK